MSIEFSRPLKIDHIDRHGTTKTIEITAEEGQALAKRFDLESIEKCAADISITPHSGATTFHLTGVVNAVVFQISVISGESVKRIISYDIDAWYGQQDNITSFVAAKKMRDDINEDKIIEREMREEKDEPEPIINNEIDLGEVAAQFLGLALDDYPRGENEDEGAGDYIEINPEDTKPNPFAVLAQLKDKT